MDNARESDIATQRCRKCQFVQPIGSKACHRCGLLFSVAARMSDQHVFDGLPASSLGESLRARWQQIATTLDDNEAHEKFIDLCQTSGHIKFAGYCYRTAMSNTTDETQLKTLKAYQARVIQKATAVLIPSNTSTHQNRYAHQLFMLIIGALLILGLAYVYFQWSQSSASLQSIS